MSRVLNGIPIHQSHLPKKNTKRQQIIYVLIQHLYDIEGWGYQIYHNG